MRGFGSFVAAAGFCSAFEEQRQCFRVVSQGGDRASLTERRIPHRERWVAVLAELTVA